VPLKDLVNKFAHVRFEPSGFTGNQEIPIAKSIVDYIFRWLGSRFLSNDDKAILGLIDRSAVVEEGDAPAPLASGLSFGNPSRLATADASPSDSTLATPPTQDDATPAVEDTPKATAVAAEPVKEDLAVIATNGHATSSAANGHANGNGKANGNGGGGGGTSAITLNLGATKVSFQTQADAPSCADCGSIMVRNGSCYKCLNCGSTSGCS
jgi:ribonucleoside-diphosphate reductase alpha chain